MNNYFRSAFSLSARAGAVAFAACLTLAATGVHVQAQHEEHQHKMPVPASSPAPSTAPQPTPAASPTPADEPMNHTMHDDHATHDGAMSGMEHSGHDMNAEGDNSLMLMSGEGMGIRVGASASNVMQMGQMGSGTSWQPASSEMHMTHRQAGDWLLMLHYEAKIGVNSQGGARGRTTFESQNWLMPMAYRKVGRGTLQLRGMFSLEPLTYPKPGSPLLFQTGETYKGAPIVDAQHPHDLFMELSAQYTMPLGERGTWFAYFGYPGEPALGPVAFMHRASASENPSAPLTHHLQDSTHISFGVLTTGFTYRGLKLEGSVFNGREPDEHRYGFEAHPWNSASARLSFAPNGNWSAQLSYGYLKNREAFEPGITRRTTASVSYNKPFDRGHWATSLIWGRNADAFIGEPITHTNGYTAESTVNFADKNYLYTRLELVDRNELLRPADRATLGIAEDHPSFRVGAYTFGAARDIWDTDDVSIALGGDFSFYSKPGALDALYGRNPTSYKFFVRFRPGKMKGAGHGGHDGH
ncbi:MAG: hypothetical protein WCD76_10515 [Pyrinomonadaceae bacterium]